MLVPCGEPHVDQKDREAVGARSCAASRGVVRAMQQHEIGMLGARGPHLLAVDDVVIALAPGRGGKAQHVGARGRLGHPEGLQPQLAARDQGQPARLLGVAAVPQQRAHRVHLGMAGGAVAAAGVDLLQDGGSLDQRETAAAIFLRDQGGQKAGLRQRLDELGSDRRARDRAGANIRPETSRTAPARRRGFARGCRLAPSGPLSVMASAFRARPLHRQLAAAIVERNHVAFDHAGPEADDRRRRATSRCGWSRPGRPAPKSAR